MSIQMASCLPVSQTITTRELLSLCTKRAFLQLQLLFIPLLLLLLKRHNLPLLITNWTRVPLLMRPKKISYIVKQLLCL